MTDAVTYSETLSENGGTLSIACDGHDRDYFLSGDQLTLPKNTYELQIRFDQKEAFKVSMFGVNDTLAALPLKPHEPKTYATVVTELAYILLSGELHRSDEFRARLVTPMDKTVEWDFHLQGEKEAEAKLNSVCLPEAK